MLGVPPIASTEAIGRARAADSLVLGGLVCLLFSALRVTPWHIGVVGIALFVSGGILWTQAVRCPKCGDRWAWRSVSKQTWRSGARWLVSLRMCPGCGYRPGPTPPPRAIELQEAIDHANDACASLLDISAAHLLLELLKTVSVGALARALDLNIEATKDAVRASLPVPIANAQPRPARFTAAVRESLQRAAIHALSSDSEEITSPRVLLEYFAEESPEDLRQILESSGWNLYLMRVVIAHGPGAILDPPAAEGMVSVVLHNDPFTTREFVCALLSEVFEISAERASELMLAVHGKGSTAIGAMTGALAGERIAELRRRAMAHRFPLRVSLEQVEEG